MKFDTLTSVAATCWQSTTTESAGVTSWVGATPLAIPPTPTKDVASARALFCDCQKMYRLCMDKHGLRSTTTAGYNLRKEADRLQSMLTRIDLDNADKNTVHELWSIFTDMNAIATTKVCESCEKTYTGDACLPCDNAKKLEVYRLNEKLIQQITADINTIRELRSIFNDLVNLAERAGRKHY